MITILTPTYNRAYTLSRLFESLCCQVDKSFEWLVVDDGSNDGTEKLLHTFSENAFFNMRTIFQENSGKHVAINTGVRHAKGSWIFIVDSDDALTPDAISVVLRKLQGLDREEIAGVCFRKAYFDGHLVGTRIKFDSDVMQLKPTVAGRKLKGDLAYIFRRDLMLKNSFPVIAGEKFVPELYIWNRIGDAGKVYFFVNKFVYLCEYLPDGYSQNFSILLKQNPRGFSIYYRSQIFREIDGLPVIKCIIRLLQCYFFIFLKRFK